MNKELLISIDNLAFKGFGVGTLISGDLELEGIRAFARYTIPGEVILADRIKQKRNYLEIDSYKILETSPKRVTPECPYFKLCGGCQLQHIDYKYIGELKLEMLRSELEKKSKNLNSKSIDIKFYPSKPYNYRRRINLHLDKLGNFGFYKLNSREIVSIDSCSISEQSLNQALSSLKKYSDKLSKYVGQVQIYKTKEKAVLNLISDEHQLDISKLKNTLKEIVNEDSISGLRLSQFNKTLCTEGKTTIEFEMPVFNDLSLEIELGCFMQTNSTANELMVERVIEIANSTNSSSIIDLYSGYGNFALPLAVQKKEVLAIESNKEATESGIKNSLRLNLHKNLSYLKASASEWAKTNLKKLKEADLVILDPPRSGILELKDSINSAKRLVLISCDFANGVRDLDFLLANGWKLNSLEIYDMFPQSTYIEMLSLLEKDNG